MKLRQHTLRRLALVLASVAGVSSNLQGVSPTDRAWPLYVIDDSSQGADGVKLGDLNRDGLPDIVTGWEEGGLSRVYLNPGPSQAKFTWPAVTIGRTPSVEDAVFVDFDDDGTLDVVTCCEGKERTVYVHWAPHRREDLLSAEKWQQAPLPTSQGRMQWMFAWPMQIDGKNGVELVAGGKGEGAEIGWFELPANARDLSKCRWHAMSPVGWVMSIWQSDMDADGDVDVVVSDRYGERRGCRWLENPGHGPAQTRPWTNHFIGARDHEVMSMDLADLDGDGLEDAVVAVKEMKIIFLKRLDETGRRWRSQAISADYSAGNTRAVRVADVNRDEKLDLVITTWNAAQKHGAFWLEYSQTPHEHAWAPHAISGRDKGIKFDRIEMLDVDGDGDLDLLTCEEQEAEGGIGVFWYENPFG
jgi:hypothetical protein